MIKLQLIISLKEVHSKFINKCKLKGATLESWKVILDQ